MPSTLPTSDPSRQPSGIATERSALVQTSCPEHWRLSHEVAKRQEECSQESEKLIETMGTLSRNDYVLKLQAVDQAKHALSVAHTALRNHERLHGCANPPI